MQVWHERSRDPLLAKCQQTAYKQARGGGATNLLRHAKTSVAKIGWRFMIGSLVARFKSECWDPLNSGLKLPWDKVVSLSCPVVFDPQWLMCFSWGPDPISHASVISFFRCWKTSPCPIPNFSRSFPGFPVLSKQVRTFQISCQKFCLSMVSLFSLPVSALFGYYILLLPCAWCSTLNKKYWD